MIATCHKMICFTGILLIICTQKVAAQPGTGERISNYRLYTYVNPVLPGDYPHPSFQKVGNDLIHARLTAKLHLYIDGYFDPYVDRLMYLFSLMPLSGNYQMINPGTC